MGGVVVELGALVGLEGVLDSELVEAQLVGSLLGSRRSTQTMVSGRVRCSETSATEKPSASRTPPLYSLVRA